MESSFGGIRGILDMKRKAEIKYNRSYIKARMKGHNKKDPSYVTANRYYNVRNPLNKTVIDRYEMDRIMLEGLE
jgi:hypothetical protein